MAYCLVLNNAYQPLGITNEENAICLIVEERARSILDHKEKVYRSQYLTIRAPKVIVLNYYIQAEGLLIRKERITRNGLFKRDNYTCQYCGNHRDKLGKNKLTKDHIIPRKLGGINNWTNITTACQKCNLRKGDRTPEQANMKLLSQPTIPVSWYMKGKSKLTDNELQFIEEFIKTKE